MRLISELPRTVQDELLACCDDDGCPVDSKGLEQLLADWVPGVAGEGEAEAAFDLIHELWCDRRLEAVAASN